MFDFHLPIVIPSLRREISSRNYKFMLEKALGYMFSLYNATNVHVIAQEYTEEDQEHLKKIFPRVYWHWFEKRLGIIGTFNKVKALGIELGPYYIHMDDDVELKCSFSDNPTLLALQSVMETMPNRIGVVTVPSISIIHFKKTLLRMFDLHCNPAQLSLINSTPAKDCEYDNRFENFRSDTDFTMQIASKGYIPVIINRYFSFMHSVPLATIKKENGKRTFETLDNVSSSKGSIGGIRTNEIKEREYTQFNQKWPLVITQKNNRAQILSKSVKTLTKFNVNELYTIDEGFNYDLVNNLYAGYWKDGIIPRMKREDALF